MFKYLHSYHPEMWEAQVRDGFIDQYAGLRFCQSLTINPHLKFNNLALRGGVFDSIVRDLKGPLLIDRLQGGCYIDDYVYDPALVQYYTELLGDDFYGFQFHEWASNLRNDLKKIGNDPDCDWTIAGIEKAIYKQYPFPHLFLEAQFASEYAEMGPIGDASTFYKAVQNLLKRRSDAYRLVPCDSYMQAYKLELDHGIRTFMPEVGAQTPDTRLQICYARSMARSYNVCWGAYYEPWGGAPFSACCYNVDKRNEWGLGGPDFPFETKGPNGGSSRSLQKRIHLYAYLSGTDFISEEWSVSNIYNDWQDFELSPYGIEKKNFLSFVHKYPNVGGKIAPIAVVLPKDLKILGDIRSSDFCIYPIGSEDAARLAHIHETIRQLFSNPVDDMVGTETRSLINSEIPDAIDLIHEDSPLLSSYEYLVDATCNTVWAAAHSNICTVDAVPALLRKLLPCYVEGGLHWMVNQCGSKYYLAIFNHSGVNRTVADGESIIACSEKTAFVSIPSGRLLQKLEGSGSIHFENDKYTITIPGGDWFFGSF